MASKTRYTTEYHTYVKKIRLIYMSRHKKFQDTLLSKECKLQNKIYTII